MALTIDNELAQKIKAKSGENVYLCYQCKKCSSGCPMAEHFDLTPNQLMRALQFGEIDKVLHSKTMWLCAYCETCVTRCPVDMDIPRIMDTLKNMTAEQHIAPPDPIMKAFVDAGVSWIKRFGRIHDVGMMLDVNMRLRKPLRDAGLGLRMLRHGKIRLLPEWQRIPKRLPAPTAKHGNQHRVAYFPGCSLHCSGTEYNESVHAAASAVGLQLAEIKGWICCGSSMAHQASHELATELPMTSLALAEAAGEDEVMFPCAACYSRFKTAVHDVEKEPELRQHVKQKLGYEYQGGIKVKNILDTFTDRVGLDVIERKAVRSLAGLKAVCYYGCLYSRPVQVTQAPDAEYPMAMDRILRRLGVETLDWSCKTACCGASLMVTQTSSVLELSEAILANAKAAGAEAIIVACSSCHLNLDMRQKDIAEQLGKQYDIPIIYFTQLMGLAFGRTPKELGLGKHFVKVDALLRRLQLGAV